ncbi:MAG: hypothetical protein EBZ91_12340 [Gammaproteobacteria bacterium]|nr:hypothetical protein [Gammaproteobacteria bacterium]
MRAVEIADRRVVVSADAFIEIVIWRLPKPLPPSSHRFKYRLAYVVAETCVLRYDNERGKGDHRHSLRSEEPYRFLDVDRLLRDFEADVARWNHENGRT